LFTDDRSVLVVEARARFLRDAISRSEAASKGRRGRHIIRAKGWWETISLTALVMRCSEEAF
jgi:hypothetical protein